LFLQDNFLNLIDKNLKIKLSKFSTNWCTIG